MPAGEHRRPGSPARGRHPSGQLPLRRRAGHHHPVAPSASSRATAANRSGRPATRRRPCRRDARPWPRPARGVGCRPAQRQVGRVGRDAVPGQQPAPAVPPRARRRATAGRRGGRPPGRRRRAAGPGRRPQQPVRLGPAPVQVDRHPRRPGTASDAGRARPSGDQPVDAADQVDQRCQPGRRGEHQRSRSRDTRRRSPAAAGTAVARSPTPERAQRPGSRVGGLLLGADHQLPDRAAGRLAEREHDRGGDVGRVVERRVRRPGGTARRGRRRTRSACRPAPAG